MIAKKDIIGSVIFVLCGSCALFIIGLLSVQEERNILRNENILLKQGYVIFKVKSSGEFEAGLPRDTATSQPYTQPVLGIIKDGKIFVGSYDQ